MEWRECVPHEDVFWHYVESFNQRFILQQVDFSGRTTCEKLSMQRIIISGTSDAVLSVDIKDILEVLDTRSGNTYWRVSGVEGESVEVTGGAYPLIVRMADDGEIVDGPTFQKIARGVHQSIWVEYSGYQCQNSIYPWISISFVDGSYIEIISADGKVLDLLKKRFVDKS